MVNIFQSIFIHSTFFTCTSLVVWTLTEIFLLFFSFKYPDSQFFDQAIEDTMQRNWKGKRAMAPKRVAEIALDAWVKRRRDVLLTPGGKALVWLDRIAPRIASWAVTRWG